MSVEARECKSVEERQTCIYIRTYVDSLDATLQTFAVDERQYLYM